MNAETTKRNGVASDAGHTDLGEAGHALRKSRAAAKKTIIGFPTFAVRGSEPDEQGTMALTQVRSVTEEATSAPPGADPAPMAQRPSVVSPPLASPSATMTGVHKVVARRRGQAPLWLGICVTGAALCATGVVLRSYLDSDPSTVSQHREAVAPAPTAKRAPAPAQATAAKPAPTVKSLSAERLPAASPAVDSPAPEPAPTNEAPVGEMGCSLHIVSSPSGAAVLLDGLPLGVTPVDAQGLACGTPVRIMVVSAQFKPWQRSVTPLAGEEERRVVRAGLMRPEVVLNVTSQPSGAVVLVGGKAVGATPLLVEVPAFVQLRVSVRKPGFGAEERTVVARSGRDNRVHALLLRMGESRQ